MKKKPGIVGMRKQFFVTVLKAHIKNYFKRSRFKNAHITRHKLIKKYKAIHTLHPKKLKLQQKDLHKLNDKALVLHLQN